MRASEWAFSETDLYRRPNEIRPTPLIVHRNHDQRVPVANSARLLSKRVKNATLKVYPVLVPPRLTGG